MIRAVFAFVLGLAAAPLVLFGLLFMPSWMRTY